jgi:hypothetical protein
MKATTPTPTPDPSALLQYGVTGTVAALAIVGLIWLYRSLSAAHATERQGLIDQLTAVRATTKQEVDAANERTLEERRRADRMESELSKLNALVQQQTMSALNDAGRAVAEALSALRRGGTH